MTFFQKLRYYKNVSPGFKQFLIRTLIFLFGFIITSFSIGQRIIDSKLLYKFNIYVYGGMGYILLFALLGFVLLYREKLKQIKKQEYKSRDFIFLLSFVVFLIVFFVIEVNINTIEETISNMILIHFVFIAMMLSLFIGIYGLGFIGEILRKFKKELFYFFIFGIFAYSMMQYAWKLWPYFSIVVIKVVYYMLLSIGDAKIIEPRTLFFKNFGAEIAEACSGIYSIFIFSALYLFIILLEWEKIYKFRAFLLFVPAVIGSFIVNIIRVFVLMVVGAYLSREAALGLYHSYTGMIFFLIYFTVFWLLAYKWIRKDKKGNGFVLKAKRAMSDSLYRNSIYLIGGAIVMSVLGFVFWIIAARLFSAEDVGLATTLISVSNLIASLSIIGLNSALIRYLPTSERKNEKINSVLSVVVLLTIIITSIFLLNVNFLSPKLSFIHDNIVYSFIFIAFMIFASINNIIESIFIAYRSAGHNLVKNAIFCFGKIAFLFLFIGFGAFGLFTSLMVPLVISTIFSFVILISKFSYKPELVMYNKIIQRIGTYSIGNYLAGIIWGLPLFLLPLLITNLMGPETTAYYYVAMVIAGFLFTIPSATSNSLFAEASYDEKHLGLQVKKAIKIISLLLLPAIVFIYLLGNLVLTVFGSNYSSEGFAFLQLLAVSCVFVAINAVFGSVFRVKGRIKSLVVISVIFCLIVLGLSYAFIGRGLGLTGVGYAWIIGNIVSMGTYTLISLKSE